MLWIHVHETGVYSAGLELGGEMRLSPGQEGGGVQAQETGPEGGGVSLSPRPCSCAVEEVEEGPRALPPYSEVVVPICAKLLSKPSAATLQSPDAGSQTDCPTPKVDSFNRKKKNTNQKVT